jgi:hypothetical protein
MKTTKAPLNAAKFAAVAVPISYSRPGMPSKPPIERIICRIFIRDWQLRARRTNN